MDKKKKYVVGTNSVDYNPKRNFAGLPFESFEVEKKMDLFRILDYFYFKLKKKSHPFFSNAFFDFGLNKVDLFHFFNTVSLSGKPWVVTYENEIPRPYLRSRRMVKALASDRCKKIIAFCNRSKNIETFLLDRHPEFKNQILEKLIVLQPAQNVLIRDFQQKDFSGTVVFTFVGVDFFRKGGAEILKAAIQLKNKGMDFKLNIVSQLKKGAWKDEYVTERDILQARELINLHKNFITHYFSLPSEKVMELFKNSHVGLLPSFGETYGYVVLEAQACGCPMITLDMPPFPEFNSNDFGWLIPVPLKEKNGTLDSDLTGERLFEFKDAVYKGLYSAMKSALLNKSEVMEKGKRALQHIRDHHSPEKNAAILEEIYRKAIGNS